jgi:hypothetical protein
VEGVGSEVMERQRAWVEVVAVKAASGEGRSGRSTRRSSVDRGAAMGSTKKITRRGSLRH